MILVKRKKDRDDLMQHLRNSELEEGSITKVNTSADNLIKLFKAADMGKKSKGKRLLKEKATEIKMDSKKRQCVDDIDEDMFEEIESEMDSVEGFSDKRGRTY